MKITTYLFFFLFISSSFSMDTSEEMEISNKKIDREGIRKVFLDHQSDLADCYNSALSHAKDKDKLNGKMVLDFWIGEDGSVTYMSMDPTRSQL